MVLNGKFYLTLVTGVALAGLALAAVACGGGDDENGDTETPSARETPSGAETPKENGAEQRTFDLLMNESDGNVFLLDGEKNPTLTVPAGATITINLTNDGSAIHNMRFGGEDKAYNTDDDVASDPAIVSPGQTAVLVFTAPNEEGTYIYQCDFHPTDMLGEIEVED